MRQRIVPTVDSGRYVCVRACAYVYAREVCVCACVHVHILNWRASNYKKLYY